MIVRFCTKRPYICSVLWLSDFAQNVHIYIVYYDCQILRQTSLYTVYYDCPILHKKSIYIVYYDCPILHKSPYIVYYDFYRGWLQVFYVMICMCNCEINIYRLTTNVTQYNYSDYLCITHVRCNSEHDIREPRGRRN